MFWEDGTGTPSRRPTGGQRKFNKIFIMCFLLQTITNIVVQTIVKQVMHGSGDPIIVMDDNINLCVWCKLQCVCYL